MGRANKVRGWMRVLSLLAATTAVLAATATAQATPPHYMKAASSGTAAPAALSASPSPLTEYPTYHNGPIIQPEVVTLYWGTLTSTQITNMQTYLAGLYTYVGGGNAPAGNAPISGQYGVVGARPGITYTDTTLPSGSIGDADVYAKIVALQAAGHLPAFNSQRVFMVFTKGITFNDGYGVSGGYCGYHHDRGINKYYSLVPYPSTLPCKSTGNGSYTADDMWNVYASHEFFEAATDPQLNHGYVTDGDNQEIGDLCNWSYTTDNITRLSFGAIQLEADNTTGACDIWSYELTPRITAVSPGTNKLDYYAFGGDRTIYHKSRNGSTWTPGRTSAWEQLGTSTFASQPITTSWGNQESIFVTGTDRGVYFKSFDGTTWTPSKTTWTYLGGPIYGTVAAIAIGTSQLEVYALGVDGGLLHKSRNSTGQWSPSTGTWETVGGGGVFNGGPAVVRYNSGVSVLGWGNDGNYYVQTPPSTIWYYVDGPYIASPVATNQTNTHFDVWGISSDYAYYHNEWTGSGSFIFEALGGTFAGPPTAGSWIENRSELVGQDFSGVYWHATKTTAGWTNYVSLGGAFLSGPSLTVFGSNTLDVFGVGTDLAAYHSQDNNGTYAAWESFAGSLH